MVSHRCKLAVRDILFNLGLHICSIELGEVVLDEELSEEEIKSLQKSLRSVGLELMEDKTAQLMEKIKTLIIDKIHHSDYDRVNFSKYLVDEMQMEYKTFSGQFSETMGMTVENFIILHKIEKVKELLLYDEQTLTDISHKMDYSSVAHLSAQFKKITGLTPTFFKSIKQHRRRLNLESI